MIDPLRQLLADTLGVSDADLGTDPSMDALPAWDSVAHLQFVTSVEEQHGVVFDAEAMLSWRTLAEVRDALDRARGA